MRTRESAVDMVMRDGDIHTSAAIAGTLLGAIHGEHAVPAQWREAVLCCRPAADRPDVRYPRPENYWSVDALALSGTRLEAGWA